MSHCNSPGTHVANDHMFILQGYEGSLLKVTNKNGKNTSVSTHHSPIRYRASCHPLIICVGALSQKFGLVHVCAEGVIRIQFQLTNQNVIHNILHINLHQFCFGISKNIVHFMTIMITIKPMRKKMYQIYILCDLIGQLIL